MNRLSNTLIWVVIIGIVLVLGALLSQQIARNLTQTQIAVLEIQSTQRKLDKLQMLVDTIPGGVCTVDEEGIITYANEGLESMSLLNRRELIGHNFTKLMPVAYRQDHLDRFLDPLFRSGPDAANRCIPEGKLIRSDGRIMTLEITIHRHRPNGTYEWMVFFDPTNIVLEDES